MIDDCWIECAVTTKWLEKNPNELFENLLATETVIDQSIILTTICLVIFHDNFCTR